MMGAALHLLHAAADPAGAAAANAADKSRAAAHYVTMAAQAAALRKPTDHERIAALIETLRAEIDAATWADSMEPLLLVEKLGTAWDCTYARNPFERGDA